MADFEEKTRSNKWLILSKSGRFKHFELSTMFYRVFFMGFQNISNLLKLK